MLKLIRKFNSKRTLPAESQRDDFGNYWIPTYIELNGVPHYYHKLGQDKWGRWTLRFQWCTCLPKQL